MADETKNVSRREFLTGLGGLGAGAVLGGAAVSAFGLSDSAVAIPASEGYLLVDSLKCSGCGSCMIACSLTHHGQSNPSLSRIQVVQDPTEAFPHDLKIYQCRQCPYPNCVEACPTGAMHVDAESGARTVDEAKCIGCERCIQACPYTPSRVQWNYLDRHAQKCDLCKGTELWDHEVGTQFACVEACPTQALSFTTEMPLQSDEGYDVDLGHSGAAWQAFGIVAEPGLSSAAKESVHG